MRYCFYFLMCLLLNACVFSPPEKTNSYKLHIEQELLLPRLSSGSGIVLDNSTAFVISDNVNGFFKLDTASFEQAFYPFATGDSAVIQDKAVKEDFENACRVMLNGKEYITAFGSGSVDSTREKLLLIPAHDPTHMQVLPARPFYFSVKKSLGINTSQLNIEAAFSTADSIYLLNRGTNESIAMSREGFERMIGSGFYKLPALSIQSYSLPMLDSFPVAFSGACYFKDNLFLFTASVEKTTDWVADGEVAGSYTGMARLDGSIVFLLPLKDASGKMMKQKLESIDVIKVDKKGNIYVVAVSDNDNGESTWYRVVVEKE